MKLTKASAKLVEFAEKLPIRLPDLPVEERSLLSRQYDNYSRWRSVIASVSTNICQKVEPRPDHFRDNDFVDPGIKFYRPPYALKYIQRFRQIELHVHLEDDKKHPSLHALLAHLMAFMCMFGSSKRIHIFFGPSYAKKVLPKKGCVIGPAHINSGSTLAEGFGEIDVWRLEESAKLATHELYHCLKLDIRQEYPLHLLKKFYDTFRINRSGCGLTFDHCRTRIIPNEAFTEMQADIFHTMYVYYNAYFDTSKTLIELLDIERKWAVYQAAKVLRHYGFEGVHDFIKGNDQTPKSIWSQDSDVFSYILLRGSLLFHLTEFLKFVSDGDRFASFHTSKVSDIKRIYTFTDLCISCVKSAEFHEAVIVAMKTSVRDLMISQSLRMTVLELE